MGLSRSFTVRGARNGSQVFVAWTDGVITGDPPTVDLLQVEAELAALHPEDNQSWSKINSFGELPQDPLSDPDSAWKLIVSVFDTVSKGEGDLPDAAREKFRARP